MKYANFIYEYNHFGRYKPTTCNLGDYIQSLAARQYFTNVDFFVDRDGLSDFRKEFKCKLIANGWYYLFDGCHQWSDCLEPLLTSVHINNTDNPNEFHNVLAKLKVASKKSPIGCRDFATQRFLQSNDIACFFSSCLTTTLQRKDYSDGGNRSGVIFSDYSNDFYSKLFPINRFINKNRSINRINALLRNYYAQEAISYVTHECQLSVPHRERFELAKALLQRYANAKLVITSRIHAALPCLGLGTPVILICPYDRKRFDGIAELLNYFWIDSGKCSISIDGDGKVLNKADYKEYSDNLRKQCLSFVHE
ncbi:polysaccharide pyruvyl transferase family protein [Sutterella wadsworthensis]|uniref:polysaccharide pyruvyl transferase family protein n=1 Tax=Sutterella wadsworthensis TaxID=40545 RepID=UPI00242DA8B6|nr:polysaccharide pyruvyl transferase family protein [Sutterella wadsworthensis]